MVSSSLFFAFSSFLFINDRSLFLQSQLVLLIYIFNTRFRVIISLVVPDIISHSFFLKSSFSPNLQEVNLYFNREVKRGKNGLDFK